MARSGMEPCDRLVLAATGKLGQGSRGVVTDAPRRSSEASNSAARPATPACPHGASRWQASCLLNIFTRRTRLAIW